MNKTKKCNKCKDLLSIDKFWKDESTKDGLNRDCILCKGKYRLKNINKFNTSIKKYRYKNLDQVMTYEKEYRSKNTEKIKDYMLDYRFKHKEEISLQTTGYRLKHKVIITNPKTFGEHIVMFRQRRGLTQIALADRINCCDRRLSLIERNLKDPDLPLIIKLCNEFNIKPNELIDI